MKQFQYIKNNKIRYADVISLDELAATHMLQGRIILNPKSFCDLSEGQAVRLYDHQQQFIGLGEIIAEQKIAAKRLLADA